MNYQIASPMLPSVSCRKATHRGAMVIGASSDAALVEQLRVVCEAALAGKASVPNSPTIEALQASERLAMDYADAAELASKSVKALKAMALNDPKLWKALRGQGIFRGHGPAGKVAFLYPGQGSQYVNMMREFCAVEPIVEETFAEADGAMIPLLGKPLRAFFWVDESDADAVAEAERSLMQTAITQPAVLAADLALTRLLAAHGIRPDFTMGHSLGEYGALVAAGALAFVDALEIVSLRSVELRQVRIQDHGRMAAVFAPPEQIEQMLRSVNDYVVIANVNSKHQAVIGGSSKAVEEATELFVRIDCNIVPLPVSHAFHTAIVTPMCQPLRRLLERVPLNPPLVPIVANLDGQFYPTAPDSVCRMLDILERHVAAPVQFVKGLETLYEAGARVFVEVGPKKALQGFADDVLGNRGEVVSLFTNHPKLDDVEAFNHALCGLYAAGLGGGQFT